MIRAGSRTISATINQGGFREVTVQWKQDESGEWEAYRIYPNIGAQRRLPDLDAIDTTSMLAMTQQFLAGDVSRVYLTPKS